MTKQQADAEAIAYFEEQFQKSRQANIDDLRDRAMSGDRWCLAMLHARVLDGDELAAAAIAASPYLQAELRRKV